jgi:hypothetical protein
MRGDGRRINRGGDPTDASSMVGVVGATESLWLPGQEGESEF